ncbi:uncharacterized protein LOC143468938 [Clavelina lepadiformis]|uniref:Fibrinogen C-terminal domain-containing protein n=1 Tax=Clavelina lepadiformis TaxID=159417 RepID=A0ABP0GYK3_CLALP
MSYLSSSTEHLAFDSSKGRNMESLFWKAVSLLALIVAFIALILGIVAHDKVISTPEQIVYNSCDDVQGPSGTYNIRPDKTQPPFSAYCDMDSDGGRWTLVASIHENDIDGKCTVGDMWSSEQGPSQTSNQKGGRNWENKNVFGRLEAVTNQDYKNPAYYSLQASDIMIWHVPNDRRVSDWSNSATFKYYTTDKILSRYDGTLYSLYSKHLPLENADPGLKPLLDQINATMNASALIDSFYEYRYDGGRRKDRILDGGNDMFDTGNRISFTTQDETSFQSMQYGQPYFFYGSGVEVVTAPWYPFLSLAWIGDLGSPTPPQNFTYKVQSNYGADGKGVAQTYENTMITEGKLTAVYTAFNVFNASDPSICEVYFYIYSKQVWNSKLPTSFIKVKFSNTTREAINIVRLTGAPQHILAGYTLLSRTSGQQVTQAHIEDILKVYMRQAQSFQFKITNPKVYSKIKYSKGNDNMLLTGIPTEEQSRVDAGFIQFRPHNSLGVPNALCPGIRLRIANNPERMCIGGANTAGVNLNLCGDYAGWGGEPGSRANKTSPSETGKSLTDINSSILIFTR